MTHDILQSDINLAIRLRADQHPDEEVIAALVQRGVDRVKASQLIDDLRNGRPFSAQPPAPPEFTAARRSRSKSRERASDAARRNGRAEAEMSSRQRRSGDQNAPVRVIMVVLVVLAVLVVGVVLLVRYRSQLNGPSEPKPASRADQKSELAKTTSAKAAAVTEAGKGVTLLLELQPDGLRIGGSRVTAANVLGVVGTLLGLPSRTNQVGQTGATVYAYDPHGLLIYSQKNGGTNSIVLDCEATGGPNGTTSPFAGVLKVENTVIGPDTDPQALASIEKLGLGKPKAGSSIWSGRYHNVDLVFAYLKAPGHLSLIEIDLR
jgi:hypothetical protein